MSIGNRIGELRKKKGYTQEYIAEQLGVSRQAVSKWEQDQTCPDTKNLIALSEFLDSTVEYLTTGNTTTAQNPQHNISKPLYITGAILILSAVILQFIGLLIGEYTEMVQIGFVGIPFLWYGSSSMAIVLMSVSAVFVIFGIILFIVAYRMKKRK